MKSVRTFPSLAAMYVCCLVLSACEFTYSGNSSSGDNDYFEEPLSSIVEKYDPALQSSNMFVSRFRDDQIKALHDSLSAPLKEAVSIEEIRALHDKIINGAGEISEFLPQQWAFRSGVEDGHDVIYSTKIVVHEKTELFYILVFLDDGKYERIHGIKIENRYPGEGVMAGVERILNGGS
ncbi:MAG: hypothetical protein AAFN50_15005 [Pseudomonadota bacterium]